VPRGARAPTPNQLVAATDAFDVPLDAAYAGVATTQTVPVNDGSGGVMSTASVRLSGIADGTDYDVYVTAVDAAEADGVVNYQAAATLTEATTLDGTPPSFVVAQVTTRSLSTFTVVVGVSEPSSVSYIAEPLADAIVREAVMQAQTIVDAATPSGNSTPTPVDDVATTLRAALLTAYASACQANAPSVAQTRAGVNTVGADAFTAQTYTTTATTATGDAVTSIVTIQGSFNTGSFVPLKDGVVMCVHLVVVDTSPEANAQTTVTTLAASTLDVTPPTISAATVDDVSAERFVLNAAVDETVTLFVWVLVIPGGTIRGALADGTPPTSGDVIAGAAVTPGGAIRAFHSTTLVTAAVDDADGATLVYRRAVDVTSLADATAYIVYVVAVDLAGNESAMITQRLLTVDVSPPVFATLVPALSGVTGELLVEFEANEPVEVFAVTLAMAQGGGVTTSLTAAQTIGGVDAVGVPVVAGLAVSQTFNDAGSGTAGGRAVTGTLRISGVDDGVEYEVFVVARDLSPAGNAQAAATRLVVRTADATPPQLTTARVVDTGGGGGGGDGGASAVVGELTLEFVANESGRVYIVVIDDDDDDVSPTSQQVRRGRTGDNVALAGIFTAVVDVDGSSSGVQHTMRGLPDGRTLAVYVVAEDDAVPPNLSLTPTLLRTTLRDATPPSLVVTTIDSVGADGFNLRIRLSEPGVVYIAVLDAIDATNGGSDSGGGGGGGGGIDNAVCDDSCAPVFTNAAGAPSSTQLASGHAANGAPVHASRLFTIQLPDASADATPVSITGLSDDAHYAVYIVARDDGSGSSGGGADLSNLQPSVSLLSVSTPDVTPPAFTQLAVRGVKDGTFDVAFRLSEPAHVYVLVVDALDANAAVLPPLSSPSTGGGGGGGGGDDTTPQTLSADEVKSGQLSLSSSRRAVFHTKMSSLLSSDENTLTVGGLAAGRRYDVLFVIEDVAMPPRWGQNVVGLNVSTTGGGGGDAIPLWVFIAAAAVGVLLILLIICLCRRRSQGAAAKRPSTKYATTRNSDDDDGDNETIATPTRKKKVPPPPPKPLAAEISTAATAATEGRIIPPPPLPPMKAAAARKGKAPPPLPAAMERKKPPPPPPPASKGVATAAKATAETASLLSIDVRAAVHTADLKASPQPSPTSSKSPESEDSNGNRKVKHWKVDAHYIMTGGRGVKVKGGDVTAKQGTVASFYEKSTPEALAAAAAEADRGAAELAAKMSAMRAKNGEAVDDDDGDGGDTPGGIGNTVDGATGDSAAKNGGGGSGHAGGAARKRLPPLPRPPPPPSRQAPPSKEGGVKTSATGDVEDDALIVVTGDSGTAAAQRGSVKGGAVTGKAHHVVNGRAANGDRDGVAADDVRIDLDADGDADARRRRRTSVEKQKKKKGWFSALCSSA
jgi:hypothetical protein